MKTTRILYFLVCSLLLAAWSPPTRAQVPAAVAARTNLFLQSRALFAQGDLAGGTKALQALNRQKSGTPEWTVELAAGLMQMGFDFRSRGDAPTAMALARLALAQLALAQQNYGPAANKGQLANVQELAGLISQHLLGDDAAAKLYFTAAVNLAPGFGTAVDNLAKLTKPAPSAGSQTATTGQ